MGREGHYVIAPKRLGITSSELTREREGEILSSPLYTKWRALYMKCTVHVNLESEYVLCTETWRLD